MIKKFDQKAWLIKSTQASGVPLYVQDPMVLHQAAKLMAAALKNAERKRAAAKAKNGLKRQAA